MSVTIKATPKTNSVLIDLQQNLQKDQEAGLRKALIDIGAEVSQEAKKLIRNGPKTGRTYGSHTASAPGQAPANRTGRLMKSVKFRARNHTEMTVGAEAEYAGYMEKGTRGREEDTFGAGRFGAIKPRPFLIKAVNNKAQDTVRIILENIDREVKR
jgi:hypothetical protein